MASITSKPSKVSDKYYTTTVTTNANGSVSTIVNRTDAKGKNPVLVSTTTVPKSGAATVKFASGTTDSEKQQLSNSSSQLSQAVKNSTLSTKSKLYGPNPTPEQTTQLNKAAGGSGNTATGGAEKVDLTDANNPLFGTGQVLGSNEGLPGAGAAALKYPVDMSPQQDHIEFKMIEYSPKALTGVTDQGGGTQISGFSDRRNANTAASQGVVVLPIQSGISDLNSTGWGSGDMSPLDAAKASIFLTGLKEGIEKSIDNAASQAKAATGDPNAAGQVKTAIASILTDAAINKPGTLARTTGAIINPNTELLFSGVTLRPFTFNFRMSARSKEEGDVIKQIIFFFKKGMSAKRTKQGLFIKAPNTFVITYKHGGSEHKAMNKIKECALLSCSVNYVPDGQYAAHADGNLTAYEMQLQFTELEPVFFDDYTGTDNVGY